MVDINYHQKKFIQLFLLSRYIVIDLEANDEKKGQQTKKVLHKYHVFIAAFCALFQMIENKQREKGFSPPFYTSFSISQDIFTKL